MKKNKYRFWFNDGLGGKEWVRVSAFSMAEGKILAQAERIMDRRDYIVINEEMYIEISGDWV